MATITNTNETEFITADDLRNRWKVSGMFLHRRRKDGTLSAYKFGKGVRFLLADVLKIERDSVTTAANTKSPFSESRATGEQAKGGV